jgi:hypothetical protein
MGGSSTRSRITQAPTALADRPAYNECPICVVIVANVCRGALRAFRSSARTQPGTSLDGRPDAGGLLLRAVAAVSMRRCIQGLIPAVR